MKRLKGMKREGTALACEPVEGPAVPWCKVYSAEERARWEASNKEPLPRLDLRALRALRARRKEEQRAAKIAAALRGPRRRAVAS